MQVKNKNGYALVIHNGELKLATLCEPTEYGVLSLKSRDDYGVEFNAYDSKADFYYNGSDDGDEYYEAAHIIAVNISPEYLPDWESIVLPDAKDVIANAVEAVKPLILAVIDKQLAATDLTYAILMVSRIECIYSDYLVTNDVLKAQKRLIDRIFHISEGS